MTVAFLEASVSPSYAFIVLRIPLPWVGGDGNSARKDFRFARDWLRKGVDFWRLFWTFFYPGSGVGESGHRVRSVSQRLYCINWGGGGGGWLRLACPNCFTVLATGLENKQEGL